jgi:transcriptional regulator with XRE-family HTH domain
MPTIGERIREARKRAGLSQDELATRISVNRSYLSLVENGKSSPTYEFLDKIASGLSLTVQDLVLGHEISGFVTVTPGHGPMYEGLADLLRDNEQMLMMNPTEEELGILKSIRVDPRFRPSKRFFVDALLDFRKNRWGR